MALNSNNMKILNSVPSLEILPFQLCSNQFLIVYHVRVSPSAYIRSC